MTRLSVQGSIRPRRGRILGLKSDPIMLPISNQHAIPEQAIEYRYIRAGGPGGQHVNKTSSAVHLRFDIGASALPEEWKQRLLASDDQRISSDGIVVIKARGHRSQELNREEARERLQALIRSVIATPKKRRPTKPSRGARQRRMDAKGRRSRTKALRGPVR